MSIVINTNGIGANWYQYQWYSLPIGIPSLSLWSGRAVLRTFLSRPHPFTSVLPWVGGVLSPPGCARRTSAPLRAPALLYQQYQWYLPSIGIKTIVFGCGPLALALALAPGRRRRVWKL